MTGFQTSKLSYRDVGLVLGPIAAVALLLLPPPQELDVLAWRTAAMATWMAVWWASGAVPVAVTALLPLVLFPLLGIASIQRTAAPYSNPLIYLFLGGFLIALAAERWSLHRRIALYFLGRIGSEPRVMVGGFMLITAFLSMWVSNTATTIMMLPVALAVVPLFEPEHADGPPANSGRFAIALMLAVAYGASVGGLATLVGTPPNALLAGFLSRPMGSTLALPVGCSWGCPSPLSCWPSFGSFLRVNWRFRPIIMLSLRVFFSRAGTPWPVKPVGEARRRCILVDGSALDDATAIGGICRHHRAFRSWDRNFWCLTPIRHSGRLATARLSDELDVGPAPRRGKF